MFKSLSNAFLRAGRSAFSNLLFLSVLVSVSPGLALTCGTTAPADCVDTNIGGIGQLLTATVPYAQLPHGMARIAPYVDPAITDRYLSDTIGGFAIGPLILAATKPHSESTSGAFLSSYDHDFETARPYYYSIRLQDSGIVVEYVPTAEAALFRFTPRSRDSVSLAAKAGDGGEIRLVDQSEFEGSRIILVNAGEASTKGQGVRQYFFAQVFSLDA